MTSNVLSHDKMTTGIDDDGIFAAYFHQSMSDYSLDHRASAIGNTGANISKDDCAKHALLTVKQAISELHLRSSMRSLFHDPNDETSLKASKAA